MPSEDEDEASQKSENKVTLHQTSAAENVKIAAAGDDAVSEDGGCSRIHGRCWSHREVQAR